MINGDALTEIVTQLSYVQCNFKNYRIIKGKCSVLDKFMMIITVIKTRKFL